MNGQPLGSLWGFKTEGLITDEKELEALNALARSKGYPHYQTALTGVGDLRYVDLTGDGHISKEDATFIGSPWPRIQYGGRADVAWKGWDLSFSWVGVHGRDVVNCMRPFEYTFQTDYQSTYKIFQTSFMAGNGLTTWPRAYGKIGDNTILDPNGNYNLMSDFLVEDGSYLKFRDITLGYTVPMRLSRRWGMERCRVYFNGDNLFTMTRFSGLDPEFTGTVTHYGTYSEGTPMMRVFTLGVDIVFGGWK